MSEADRKQETTPPLVAVERPNVPLMWLDTSVLIRMVRAQRSPAEEPRLAKLYQVAKGKLREGKLLAIESEQTQEVEGHPGAREVRSLLRELTFHVQVRPRLDRDAFQIGAAMRAFLAGESRVEVPRRVFFAKNPDDVLAEVLRQGWFLTVDSDMHPELVARAKGAKERTVGALERLRRENQKKGVRFEQQFEIERANFLEGQRAILERWQQEVASPRPDPLLVFAGSEMWRHARTWAQLGGLRDDLGAFFRSEHFLRLPCNDIQFRLYADLVTSSRSVQPSDAMDIQHMTATMPIATWIVTDRSLANRVRRSGIARQWGTVLFALQDLDDLLTALEAL